MLTCCNSTRWPPMRFAAFNPRVLWIRRLCLIVQMLVFAWAHSWGILYGHCSRSECHTPVRAGRNSGVVHTCWRRRCCHVAGHTALMIAEKTRSWLLHSTRRVREVHVLTGSSLLVSGEARVKMREKMLRLHIAAIGKSTASFFVVRTSAYKCSALKLFINYKSNMLMNNAVRQTLNDKCIVRIHQRWSSECSKSQEVCRRVLNFSQFFSMTLPFT